jgi:hypothetical protein
LSIGQRCRPASPSAALAHRTSRGGSRTAGRSRFDQGASITQGVRAHGSAVAIEWACVQRYRDALTMLELIEPSMSRMLGMRLPLAAGHQANRNAAYAQHTAMHTAESDLPLLVWRLSIPHMLHAGCTLPHMLHAGRTHVREYKGGVMQHRPARSRVPCAHRQHWTLSRA